MMTPRARRVLVALHPGDELDEALDDAAEMAAELGAELSGLFLEDPALFDLCGLPSVEINRATGLARRLDRESLERQLRATAEAARLRLSRVAAQRRVSWSFEVRRGRPGETVIEAAARAEMVVAGGSAFVRLGALQRSRRVGPVVVLLQGGPAEAAVLQAAARAARRAGAPLVGLLVGDRTPEARNALAEIAQGAGCTIEFRETSDDPDSVAKELESVAPRLLVLDARGGPTEFLARYLAAAGADALLVTPP